MTEPEPEKTPEPEQPRKCPRCGGLYDQPPADAHIAVCNNCLRELAVRP